MILVDLKIVWNIGRYNVVNYILKMSLKYNFIEKDMGENELVKIYKRFSNMANDWNIMNISYNPNLTIELAKKLFDFYISTRGISSNPGISIEDIFANEHLDWDWDGVCMNPNLRIHHLPKLLEKTDNLFEISRNEGIKWEDIENNPHIDWHPSGIIKNPNVTWDIVKRRRDIRWNDHDLLWNHNTMPYMIEEMIEENYEILEYCHQNVIDKLDIAKLGNEEWELLSSNENVSWEFIKRHIRKPWNWNLLSSNPYIPLEEFFKRHDVINWKFLSSNPTVNWNIIQKYPEKPWNKRWFSFNPNVTCKIVEENPDWGWEFDNLVENSYLLDQTLQKRSKKIIVNAFNRYKMKKRIPIIANRYRICGEIKFMPNRGIEFFNIKDELENLVYL